MDINLPKQKIGCKLPVPKPLPLIMKENGEFYKYRGIFDGFSVIINDVEDMKKLVSMGYFGKASLSRSFPQFDGNWDKPIVIRERQYRTRIKWNEKYNIGAIKKIIVTPDSGDEEYFINLKTRYEIDKCGNKETVNLMLEEAFFLQDACECLEVFNNNQLVPLPWDLFCDSNSLFPIKYAVYYHFRCKNWVVKPGIKFGGDFLLYKQGPPFYHASYVVLILNDEKIETTTLMGLQRMCETSGKELLICQVTLPDVKISQKDIQNVKIKEILMKRWISSQERNET